MTNSENTSQDTVMSTDEEWQAAAAARGYVTGSGYQPLPDPVHHGDIFARIETTYGSQS